MTDISPQARAKCCCPSWTTPKECICIRYGRDDFDLGDECECACHEDEDDDRWRDWHEDVTDEESGADEADYEPFEGADQTARVDEFRP